jgi:hypothetical protein
MPFTGSFDGGWSNLKSMTGTTRPARRDVMLLLAPSPPPVPTKVTLGTGSPRAFFSSSLAFTSEMIWVLCE